ncbi:MAG: hypothetical protein ABI416_11915 [Ginsengibacter sp.]
MRRFISLIIIFILSLPYAIAQMNNIPGQYSLRGVMETASGLQLNKDSSFEFYFSYGALDRSGSGNWAVNKDNIILDSRPYPGKDFKMVDSASVKNEFITVKIQDANTDLYRLVYCLVKGPTGDTLLNADINGMIVVPYPAESIHLLSELSTERMSTFAINSKKYISYTFHFEPWITEVFFKSFPLRYAEDHLEGKHPLLDEKEYKYEREKE